MSTNISFKHVIKNVLDNEGVDISSLILNIKNHRVAAVTPEQMSKEYLKYKDKYLLLSKHHIDGTELTAEEMEINTSWNRCHDRCEDIVAEMTTNIWYFFREILVVPHELVTHGEIITDIRPDDDLHYQLSEWSAKALWMYEHRVSGVFMKYTGMQRDIFFAGLILYELFRVANEEHRESSAPAVYTIIHYMALAGDSETNTTIDNISNTVWIMLHAISETYPFLEDLSMWIMDCLTGALNFRAILVDINRYETLDDMNKEVSSTKGFAFSDQSLTQSISGIYNKSYGGKTSMYFGFIDKPEEIDEYPELTFQYMMMDNSAKCSTYCRGVFGIRSSISEMLLPHNKYQKIAIHGLLNRYARFCYDYTHIDDATPMVLREIGYVTCPPRDLDMDSMLHKNILDRIRDLLSIVSGV